ncbi:MAG: endolytic transglycosylase MltG [Saprospiraceae bacterium]|nr:endolytic transglycosylase MltG [Saprospiraceae bacterium]
MNAKKSSARRGILALLLVLLLGGAYFAWEPIKGFWFPAVPAELADPYVCIPTGSSFEDVVKILKQGDFVRDEVNFRWLADQMKYKKDKMRTGRFEIEPGWTNRELIQHLRNGEQAPVKVVLNNERLTEEVAGKASRFIESDSLALLAVFQDKNFLQELGYSEETLLTAFIPNTYEMYWNTDPKTFVNKMVKEHAAFWDKNNRREKAKALGMTEKEVYTLASIVERETNANSEKATIAGVYLNRLRIGMKLQADPTSVFATRDFGTRRVTEYHTSFDSPFNTYVYKGLPPGPISMASIPSIDAVLNAENHKYLYFCAKPDESGTHAFAETFAAHKVNAQRFQAYVRKNRM